MVLLLLAILAGDFYLHDGDTVVFYGDSITNQRLYTVFTETFVLTRFPRMKIRFIHSGWSGDRVSGGGSGAIDVRLDRDLFAYNPTAITIMLGMNDAEYRPFDQEIFEKYTSGYAHILDMIKARAPKARVTVLEPSAYDDITRAEEFPGGYNSVLLRYGKFVRETSAARGLTAADMNAPVVALLKAVRDAEPGPSTRMIPDRVHPGPGVHLAMAGALLKAWHAPEVVTSVVLDGAAGMVVAVENAKVDSMEGGDGLSWKELDGSLPMPVETDDETLLAALRYSGFTEALNREVLKVTGLARGKYRLEIDGGAVGTFGAEELEKGINLATLNTPMLRQARRVLDLTYRHNHLRFARMMMVENALKEYHPVKMRAALKAMDELHEEVVALQRAAAVPVRHSYRISGVEGR
jgi:lysophospholipase L1-like esterase